MSDIDDAERTEEATPEKRRRAREDGQFPRARDTGAMAASLVALGVLALLGGAMVGSLVELCRHCFTEVVNPDIGSIHAVGRQAGRTLLLLAAPVALSAATAAVIAGLAEAGLHLHLDFKWDRLEPLSKLQNLLSPKTAAVNTLLSLARVGVVAAVAHEIVSTAFPGLVRLTQAPLPGAVGALLDVLTRLAIWSTLALAALTGVDYLNAWWRHERDIRMSRQEMKEELHNQEGNPRVKARQRARAREQLRRSIRKEVKTADVIVTNPTHVAVAVRYRADEGAPVVAAKGYEEVALFIRALAGDYGIPIVENKPLARTLADRVKPGRVIPVDLYAAVAEVLAFVYRLKNRGHRA